MTREKAEELMGCGGGGQGLCNYMFCLDLQCACHPSINSESGRWSRWQRKEFSWSLTLFSLRKRETTDPEDTSDTPRLISYEGCEAET